MNSIRHTQEQLLVASSIGYVDCDAKFHFDTLLLHLWVTFSGDIHISLQNNQNHKLMVTITFQSLTSNMTFATLMATYPTNTFNNALT